MCRDFLDNDVFKEIMMTVGLKVFVPEKWTGISGVPPLELVFKDTLPKRIRPKARSINPKLYANCCLEYERMLSYMWVPCNSDIAS